jgi:hypothetical protein
LQEFELSIVISKPESLLWFAKTFFGRTSYCLNLIESYYYRKTAYILTFILISVKQALCSYYSIFSCLLQSNTFAIYNILEEYKIYINYLETCIVEAAFILWAYR